MMHDGRTRKLKARQPIQSPEAYLQLNRITLLVINGPASGSEYSLDNSKIVVGRGPGVDLAFDDESISREHMAFELGEGGFRVRDLASTNGVRINGKDVLAADLAHGDTVELGQYQFKYIVEANKAPGKTHVISDS